MSKPLFRLNVTREQTELLLDLLRRTVAPAEKGLSVGNLWVQVIQGCKYYGIDVVPAPIVPPPTNTAA